MNCYTRTKDCNEAEHMDCFVAFVMTSASFVRFRHYWIILSKKTMVKFRNHVVNIKCDFYKTKRTKVNFNKRLTKTGRNRILKMFSILKNVLTNK